MHSYSLMKKMYYLLFLISIILLSGCTAQPKQVELIDTDAVIVSTDNCYAYDGVSMYVYFSRYDYNIECPDIYENGTLYSYIFYNDSGDIKFYSYYSWNITTDNIIQSQNVSNCGLVNREFDIEINNINTSSLYWIVTKFYSSENPGRIYTDFRTLKEYENC